MEILVIGTEPPCVRCQRTFQLAQEVARQFTVVINVRKISLKSEEAQKYGKIRTAHDIAEVANITFDKGRIRSLGQGWSIELDNELKPFKEKAEEMGYLMTPVLLINGQVKSMGFVPDKDKIREWVEKGLEVQS